jgi:hypothetical protein
MGTFAPNGGSGTVGQHSFPLTDYVAMSCYWTTVTGAGDTLTINWAALPIQCFEGGCGWNYAIELVGDSAAQWDGGLVGWWRLDSAGGPAQDARPGAKPTEADLERLIEAMERWLAQAGERYCLDTTPVASSGRHLVAALQHNL